VDGRAYASALFAALWAAYNWTRNG